MTLRSSHRKEYRAWLKMLSRCHDAADPRYPRYGGRGIAVCAEWFDSFEAFLADMGPAPTARHTLERTDNDQGYSKENCRWATWKEQAQNRVTNRRLVVGELDLTMAQWADRLGVSRKVIWKRLALGWPVERAVTEAARKAA